MHSVPSVGGETSGHLPIRARQIPVIQPRSGMRYPATLLFRPQRRLLQFYSLQSCPVTRRGHGKTIRRFTHSRLVSQDLTDVLPTCLFRTVPHLPSLQANWQSGPGDWPQYRPPGPAPAAGVGPHHLARITSLLQHGGGPAGPVAFTRRGSRTCGKQQFA